MLQELAGRWTSIRVLDQTLRHEFLKERTPLAGDRRRFLLDYVQDNLALAFLDVGRITICELVGENARTPNVNFAVVPLLPLYQFRRHPTDSAHTA